MTLCNPVAGHSSFLTRVRHTKDMGDSEQTPNDLAMYADYTHLTAMLAPRAALLTFNQTDNCCFEATYALPPMLDAARPIYELYGKASRLSSHVNEDPGTHNFAQDNRQALYRKLRDHFFEGSRNFDATEIPSDDEVKTKDELNVDLPKQIATFNSLAIELSRSLPRDAALAHNESAAKAWQDRARDRLNQLIRSELDQYDCTAEQQDSFSRDKVRITYWRLKIGGDWTVPAVEFDPPGSQGVAIVVNDAGRSSSMPAVVEQLAAGKRVLAVDPFYFGESKISQLDFLYGLLVASIGRRPLGIQANQIAAVARWKRQIDGKPVSIIAYGPRCGVLSLVAAAIEPEAISDVVLHEPLASLKQVIEANQTAQQTPELFCFGLLEQFDVLHLAALVAPRPVTIHNPSERVAGELATLGAWYLTLGTNHDPLNRD